MSGEGRERVDVVLNGFVLDDLKSMMMTLFRAMMKGADSFLTTTRINTLTDP